MQIKMTIGKKLGSGFGVVLFLMVLSGALTYFRVSEMQTIQSYILETRVPTLYADYELQTRLHKTQLLAADAMLLSTGRGRAGADKELWTKEWGKIDGESAKLQAFSRQWYKQVNRDRLAQIQSMARVLRENQEESLNLAASGNSDSLKQAVEEMSTVAKPQSDTILKILGELMDSHKGLMDAEGRNLKATSRSIVVTLGLAIALALTLGTALAIYLARQISAATASVLAQAEAVAAGDLTRGEVKLVSHDELGELTVAINKMHGSLRKIIVSITENAERVASSSEEFAAVSQQIKSNSEAASSQATTVSTATEKVNKYLQTVV